MSDTGAADAPAHPPRRDFLYLMTGSVAAVGVAAVAWPFIDQMNPDAATIAAAGPVDVDVTQIQPGQRIVILWASRPVFVVRRTPEALKGLREPKLTSMLRDPDSQTLQQPDYARNWHRSIKEEFLVVVGICTHLGCVPLFLPSPDASTPAPDWPGGFFCPCHGSKYDLAARVFQGVPAPYNLPVPPNVFPDDKTLRIGENPPGEAFDFNSILQV
ncbi:ubiquinol-cytochrome c reductase iron-sulfur subunit [Roseiarcus fermentans]|uniref:Ubiquinol-cytochrome c reductase iron-sulfur subunit n=1 Tax=Roseiarcus fermentans TaxID=1473586 RepID=A0A366FS14_9HYPH|nr:ubiquinol-cytochrome c reductase iron-sulfur subunit [Roseiarcus fermentans]RBP16525.1 ubiquinol-cytochrome c reductase iron-sulfur subunit [Roseiarcus fermentans]